MPEKIDQKYIIQDLVPHTSENNHYKPRKPLSSILKNILKQLRLLLIIIMLSCGIGFIAFMLPDFISPSTEAHAFKLPHGLSASKLKSMATSGDIDQSTINDLKSKFDNLSESEKHSLMKQYGGK